MKFTYTATRRVCYIGYITQGIINNLSPILFIIFQSDFGLSYEKLGSLILINFVTQLIVDIISVKFVDKLGYRIPIVASHAFAALGLVLMGVLPAVLPDPYIGLVIASITGGIGGGLLEVLLSPLVDSLPAPEHQKASAMSLLHSFYCWGQMLVVLATTLLLRVIGGGSWYFLPVGWAIVPIVNMLLFLRVPFTQTLPMEKRTELKTLLRAPSFVAILVLMLCAGASELTVSQWSSLFAEQALGISKLWGDIAGPCMFAALMGLGRIIYGVWGVRIKLIPFMTGMTALCVVCYLIAALSRNPVLSLIGCAVCGFSVSIMWPGTFSAASARFPLGGAAMFGLMAMFGDIGCAFGPWLAGIVADNSHGGLNAGILAGTVFPLAMIIILCTFLISSRRSRTL